MPEQEEKPTARERSLGLIENHLREEPQIQRLLLMLRSQIHVVSIPEDDTTEMQGNSSLLYQPGMPLILLEAHIKRKLGLKETGRLHAACLMPQDQRARIPLMVISGTWQESYQDETIFDLLSSVTMDRHLDTGLHDWLRALPLGEQSKEQWDKLPPHIHGQGSYELPPRTQAARKKRIQAAMDEFAELLAENSMGVSLMTAVAYIEAATPLHGGRSSWIPSREDLNRSWRSRDVTRTEGWAHHLPKREDGWWELYELSRRLPAGNFSWRGPGWSARTSWAEIHEGGRDPSRYGWCCVQLKGEGEKRSKLFLL